MPKQMCIRDRKKTEKKTGLFARGKAYLASVRSEMKRVVWPTKNELVNYTVAVCALLIVVGVAIALLDLVTVSYTHLPPRAM